MTWKHVKLGDIGFRHHVPLSPLSHTNPPHLRCPNRNIYPDLERSRVGGRSSFSPHIGQPTRFPSFRTAFLPSSLSHSISITMSGGRDRSLRGSRSHESKFQVQVLHVQERLQNNSQKQAFYRVEQKNLAKFSDTGAVMADWLCIGSPRLASGRKAGNSNIQQFLFCNTLYSD